MLSRQQDAILNGVSLRGVDSRVIVRSINEDSNDVDFSAVENPGRHGQRMLAAPRRRGKTIYIDFAIRELYDLTERAEILDTVNAWAQDGYLQTSNRPGKRIHVVCTNRATAANLREYTTDYRIELMAFRSPFWEDDYPAQTPTITGNSSVKAAVPGTAETACEARITATGALNAMTLTVTGADGSTRTMAFSGLGMVAGDVLSVGYDDNGYLFARANSVSVLAKRSATSADELTVSPGGATFVLTGNTANFTGYFSMRGRYL